MPTDRELNRRLKEILKARGVTVRGAGPAGRHRQPDRWNRVVRWVCLGSLVTIAVVTVTTLGWWAMLLTGLALAVGLIGISVDG